MDDVFSSLRKNEMDNKTIRRYDGDMMVTITKNDMILMMGMTRRYGWRIHTQLPVLHMMYISGGFSRSMFVSYVG